MWWWPDIHVLTPPTNQGKRTTFIFLGCHSLKRNQICKKIKSVPVCLPWLTEYVSFTGILRKKSNSKKYHWKYKIISPGYNYRLSDINCALGVSQLNKIDKFIHKRNNIFKMYNKQLSPLKNKIFFISGKLRVSTFADTFFRSGPVGNSLLFHFLCFHQLYRKM